MLRVLGNVWLVAGEAYTHPWDASAYLIEGECPTLIDCGSSEGYPAVKQSLEELGYEPRDIVQVLATHGHWDHLSGLVHFREEGDPKLSIHDADRAQVETGDFDLTSAFLYNRQFPPLRVDGTVHDGDEVEVNGVCLQVIHTPGHTPGSVCYLTTITGIRLLIAGDTIQGGFHPRVRSDMDAWTRSLDRLLELDFDVMTIGHHPHPLIFDAKHRLERLRKQFGAYFSPWFELAGAS